MTITTTSTTITATTTTTTTTTTGEKEEVTMKGWGRQLIAAGTDKIVEINVKISKEKNNDRWSKKVAENPKCPPVHLDVLAGKNYCMQYIMLKIFL